MGPQEDELRVYLQFGILELQQSVFKDILLGRYFYEEVDSHLSTGYPCISLDDDPS